MSALLIAAGLTEFIWMVPLCLAIAIVSAASHRDQIGDILRHAARGTVVIVVGLLVFMVSVSVVFEWLLP